VPALCSVADAEREIARVEKAGARYLALGQGLYPRLLAELEDAPPLLTARGNLNLLDRTAVAIVGARNASAAACRFARGLAHDLGQNDLVVVSGLARGIDTAAHDGALETGTIGVVAGGIDIFYPPENEARQRAMYERGLVLAEMPPGTEPRARHFPYRNRVIAGISAGTVVVEAAPRSGSLITARLAAEAGRDVMAVPGSPLDPRAQGCNQLIRDGATLIQSAADVVEAIRLPTSMFAPRQLHTNRPNSSTAMMRFQQSRNCSGRRRFRSTRSCACQALPRGRFRWRCSSSIWLAASTGTLGTRSVSGPKACAVPRGSSGWQGI